MTNKVLGRAVYIRLSEDGESFFSTVKYANVYAKTTEFLLRCESNREKGELEEAEEKVLVRYKKR